MNSLMKGFYDNNGLDSLGLKKFGKNVLISKDTRIYLPENLSLGDNVRIDAFSVLTGNIDIGSYVHIGNFCFLSGVNNIRMGNFSSLSPRVSIFTASEDFLNGSSLTNPTIPKEYRKTEYGSVTLGEHCIAGASSIILPSTRFEEGSVLGANSLAKGVYNAWMVYVGSPAKAIKKRPKKKILEDANRLLDN